jgi:hypothetical protein
MKNMLRGMLISILFYFVVITITLMCVRLCGGWISHIPTDAYIGIGVLCGFVGMIINEKLD